MTSFGLVVPSFGPFVEPAVFTEIVRCAEELGYDDLWFGDHVAVPSYAAAFTHPDWVEPLAAIGLALGQTRRIRVGTDVLVAPYRHPLLLAKTAASLHQLSGGRLILGVGVGYLRGEFAALGQSHLERGARTDEVLQIWEQLWSDPPGPVSFDGAFHSFEEICFGPVPAAGPPPVWVGGNASAALARAARHGDGWHPLFPTPEGYAEARAQIEAERARLGRDEHFTWSMSCASTSLLAEAPERYEAHLWEDVPEDFGYAPPAPTDTGGRPRFVGTPDQVRSDVAAYVEAGVEHLTLRFANGGPDVGVEDLLHQMRWFADEVAPSFRPAGAHT